MTYDKTLNINERRVAWANNFEQKLECILKTSNSEEVIIKTGDKRRNKANPYVIPKDNLKDILSYWNTAIEKYGMKPYSASQVMSYLIHLANAVKKPFEEYTENDLDSFFGGYKQNHANFLKRVVKSFLRWKGNPIYIKIKYVRSTQKFPEILTLEEVQEMSNKADNPRDRLIPILLYELGCRASEFCCIKIKDILFNGFSCKIHVAGKTGERIIPVVQCVPLLTEYINFYKGKDKKENYLFCGFTKNTYNQEECSPLTPSGLTAIIQKLVSRAGIKKRVYNHLFRHSRLSNLAVNLSSYQLKQFAGWKPSSNMDDIYVQMNCSELENKLLEVNHVVKQKEETIPISLTIKCPNPACNTIQSISNKFCQKCYQPLQVKEITETDRIKDAIIQILPKLIEMANNRELQPEDMKEILKSTGEEVK